MNNYENVKGSTGHCNLIQNILTDSRTAEYFFEDVRGDAKIVLYRLFPGINLAYYFVHMNEFSFDEVPEGEFIEISHCSEGRMEHRIKGGSAFIMPGDLSIVLRRKKTGRYLFPLSHYHGITFFVDINTAPECLSCLLEDVNVKPAELSKKLCPDGDFYIIRSEDYIEHIFSEMYTVPESYKIGYLKVKALELLLVLGDIDPKNTENRRAGISSLQIELAKKGAEYLSENLKRKVSVSELADKFNVSQTHIQNAFKGVYGVPISEYIRVLKMQEAALKLITTNLSVLEIAGEYGYDNSSKFASAFCKIMGDTPCDYRKMHYKR